MLAPSTIVAACRGVYAVWGWIRAIDLRVEWGPLTGAELAAFTGLPSGVIIGGGARLERAGYLYRQPDPDDGHRQLLRPAPEGTADIADVFAGLQSDSVALVAGFDTAHCPV